MHTRMTMSANRYSSLIKKSSEEDLKLYIYIIESELGYRRGEVIDLSNMNKSHLQFKLGELIREKLNIKWKYLEGDDLDGYESEDLDDFISILFSRAQQVRGDISKQIEWLSEPRALYFFSVLMRSVINNEITDLSYPVTSIDFKTANVDFKTAKNNRDGFRGEFAQIFLDSTKRRLLAPIKSICPNKTLSAQDSITRTLEYIAVSCNVDDQKSILEIINDIESLYQICCDSVNIEWKVFNSNDEKLNAWYCRTLMKKYPGTGLNATRDPIKQKHTVMCIFDVLCATTSPDDLNEKSSNFTFKKVVKELTDSFSRKANSASSQSKALKTKEEKTLTFSEVDWTKLIEIAGSSTKNDIKAKLRELIDQELAHQRDRDERSLVQDVKGDFQSPDKSKDSKQSINKLFDKPSFGRPLLKRD